MSFIHKIYSKRLKDFVLEQRCIPWFIIERWQKSFIRNKLLEYKAMLFNINTSTYWDSVWEKESIDVPDFRLYFKKFSTIISVTPPKSKVLDLGCGLGILMERLVKEKGCDVSGIDISNNAVECIIKKGMKAKQGKIPPIPYQNETFDVVIATELLEHFNKPTLILKEMYRVVKKSGMVIVSVPENHGPDTNREHVKTYTYDSLENLISKITGDYKIIKIKEEKGWESHLLAIGYKIGFEKHYLFLRKFSENEGFGGLENLLIDWFKRIDQKINKITLAVSNGKSNLFTESLSKNNMTVSILEYPFKQKGSFLSKWINLYKFIKNLKPNVIVYVQGDFYDFTLTDVLVGYLYTIGNVYMTEHLGAPLPLKRNSKLHLGFIPGLGLWWYRKMLILLARSYLSKRILAVSEEVKERLVKYYKYPEKKIAVKYHGISCDIFTPNDKIKLKMRKEYEIPENNIVIISTARLSYQKRLDRLINAFDKVNADFNNSWLILIGSGPLEAELKELASHKLAKSKIQFWGFKKNIKDFLRMSDIFILPSDNEGFGIALLEAMATGLICVSTKTPGPSEIIINGVNGFLVDRSENDVYLGLYNAILLSKEEKEQISLNSITSVANNFDIEKNAYDELEVLGLSLHK